MGKVGVDATNRAAWGLRGRTDHRAESHGELEMSTFTKHVLPATVAIGLTIAAIMLFDRRTVVEMQFVSLYPEILAPGESAGITWKTKVLRPGCDGTVTREIIDAAGVIYVYQKNQSAINPKISPQQFTGVFYVPPGVVQGPAIHRTIAVRWCNELQRLIWPMADPIRDVPIVIAAHR